MLTTFKEASTQTHGGKGLDVKALAERANALANKVNEHRTVNLVYKSCCGCGCYDTNITRVVPFDSPLQNGDRVETMLPTDEYADD